ERGIVIEFPTTPGTRPQFALRLLVFARRAKLVYATGQDKLTLAPAVEMLSVGGVVGSPQPQETTSMLPSTNILLFQAKPEPGGGSMTVGEEFTGAAVKRVNLSPMARPPFPANDTFKVPPRSTVPASISSLIAVVPFLPMSINVVPRKVSEFPAVMVR